MTETWICGEDNRVLTPHRSRRVHPVGFVILHDTATPYRPDTPADEARMRRWLSGKGSKSSTHFVIMRSGKILQAAPLEVITWHAGQSSYRLDGRRYDHLNAYSIGVDFENIGGLHYQLESGHVKPVAHNCYNQRHLGAVVGVGGKPYEPYTDQQYDSALGLFFLLAEKYKVLQDRRRWLPHSAITSRKADVTPAFYWGVVDEAVKKARLA